MIVTRFAPSPTGKMHLGNTRTALFNYLYARHMGGRFLLRIEDTDKERSTDDNVTTILQTMKDLKLDHDGDIVYQSHNLARHTDIANEMIARGMAYRAYDTKDELDAMRAHAQAKKMPYKYNGVWKDANHPPYPDDKPYVVRIRNTFADNHVLSIDDRVQGNVTVKAKEIDDFIILRSDGSPTYLLSVVVDDHDAGVNMVIRGDDHLTNTFRQYLIYHAMGWDVPSYAHLPLIHGPDGKKLSKRNGSMSIEDLKAAGFDLDGMPGVVNYLACLGWTPKIPPLVINIDANTDRNVLRGALEANGWTFKDDVDIDIPADLYGKHYLHTPGPLYDYLDTVGKYKIREIFSMDDMINLFDIDDVNKAPAQFDMKKLLHVNGYWMAHANDADFRNGLVQYLSHYHGDVHFNTDDIYRIAPCLKIRSKTFDEAYHMIEFLNDDMYDANIKNFDIKDVDMKIIHDVFDNIHDASLDVLDAMKKTAETFDVKLKKVANMMRIVLTGQKISPPMHDVIHVLGNRTEKRVLVWSGKY